MNQMNKKIHYEFTDNISIPASPIPFARESAGYILQLRQLAVLHFFFYIAGRLFWSLRSTRNLQNRVSRRRSMCRVPFFIFTGENKIFYVVRNLLYEMDWSSLILCPIPEPSIKKKWISFCVFPYFVLPRNLFLDNGYSMDQHFRHLCFNFYMSGFFFYVKLVIDPLPLISIFPES